MGFEIAKVWVTARGDASKVAGDFQRAKPKVMSSARSMVSGVNSILATMGIGAGVGAFVTLLRSGEDFNQKMRSSLAIMGEVSDTLRNDMRQAALEAAAATQFGAAQAAESFFYLASAGLDAKQSIAAMPQVAKFAQAGMFDLSRATDLATDAQSALGMTVKDAQQNLTNLTRVTDVLVKANTLANASVEQFSMAITTKAGAAAKIVGKDIEELTAVLAAYADQGLKSSEAGTAINIVFRDLQTKAIDNKKAFKEAGVAVFDSAGNMNNMADIVGDLEKRLAGLSAEGKKTALMQMGFADKSLIFIQTLLGTSEKIRIYEKELRKAGGTTKEVADKQMTPLQKAVAKLGATLTELSTTVMKFVVPALVSFFDVVGSMAGAIGRNLSGLVRLSLVLLAFLGGIKLVTVAMWAYARATEASTKATAFFQGLVLGPVAWIKLAAGIAAAAAAAIAFDETIGNMEGESGESADKMKKTMDEIKRAIMEATEGAEDLDIAFSKIGKDKEAPDSRAKTKAFLKTLPIPEGFKFDIKGPVTEGMIKAQREFVNVLDNEVGKAVEAHRKSLDSLKEAEENIAAFGTVRKRQVGPGMMASMRRLETPLDRDMMQRVKGRAEVELEGKRKLMGIAREFWEKEFFFLNKLEEAKQEEEASAERMRVLTNAKIQTGIKDQGNYYKGLWDTFKVGASSAKDAVLDLAGATKKAFNKIQKPVIDLMEDLKEEVDLFGLKGFERRWESVKRDPLLKEFAQAREGEFDRWVIDLEKKVKGAELVAKAKSLTEEMMTPAEKAKKELDMIDELMKLPLDKGGISFQTAQRARSKIQKDLKPEPLVAAGRFGFADFGTQIQDAILKRDDPQKAIEKNTKETAKNTGLNVDVMKKVADKLVTGMLVGPP